MAHILYEAECVEYTRELAEYSKTETSIDIQPGAEISEYFFIDYGTGVVIGETATVGDWVRIYQNVTLGALHFEKEEDEDHMLAKDYKRHPDIGDHVVIGAGSNVFGAVEIGDYVSIGANSWVTDDIPDNTSVFVANHPEQKRKSNSYLAAYSSDSTSSTVINRIAFPLVTQYFLAQDTCPLFSRTTETYR